MLSRQRDPQPQYPSTILLKAPNGGIRVLLNGHFRNVLERATDTSRSNGAGRPLQQAYLIETKESAYCQNNFLPAGQLQLSAHPTFRWLPPRVTILSPKRQQID